MVLQPSDFTGEEGTAVGGRVVLARMATVKGGGKGVNKGGGKGKGAGQDTSKCEVHLMGGRDMSDMLFIEAWGDAAETWMSLAVRGRYLVIERAQYVSKRPLYTTSKLPYFLRLQGPYRCTNAGPGDGA